MILFFFSFLTPGILVTARYFAIFVLKKVHYTNMSQEP